MNTGIDIQLSQKQQMTLTPKMVEELKVLQMSSVDLMQYIDMQLIENPLLEKVDEDPLDIDSLISEINENYEDESEYEEKTPKKDFTQYKSNPLTLRQYLLQQIGETRINSEIRKIVLYLIETINDDGYLGTSIIEVSRFLNISEQKAKEALKVIQSLEPTGIGARNLKECILIQLRRTKQLCDLTKTVVMNYLELLAEKKYKKISEKIGIPVEQIKDICKQIKCTNPKPGLMFSVENSLGYIQPELTVNLIDDKFMVFFTNGSILNLKVSEYYKKFIKNEDSTTETKKYIKLKISKAIDVINSIEQRKRTILNVTSCIIEYQGEFLRKGHMFLRPLTLKTVADKVGMHESTISRTVNGKYIETPRGVFELKFFFSAQVDTDRDTCISANAVKKAIKDIVKNEDKKSPLSDEEIRKKLENCGVNIARRTIAKYREELSILPSKMR